MRRTNLHSNVEVVMLLMLCTNFQVFAHFALQSSPMKLYFWCLANVFLKSLTNIFCLLPSFFTWNILKHLRYLCCKKYRPTARHRTEYMTFPGTPIANQWFSPLTTKICLLCETIFVEEFYTFTERRAESVLFLFSASHSTFSCSAKIK